MKTIHRSPLRAEFCRGPDHFAPPAKLRRHLHVDEGLLAALALCLGALLATGAQPISTGPLTAEALCCLGVPALLALLLLRRLPFAITVATPLVRAARQAVAFAAALVGGMLGKPSGRQGLVALLADLRLLSGWMVRIAQPATRACSTEASPGIVASCLGHTRTPFRAQQAQHRVHVRRPTIETQLIRNLHQDTLHTHCTRQAARPATGNSYITHPLDALTFCRCSRWQGKQCTQPSGCDFRTGK